MLFIYFYLFILFILFLFIFYFFLPLYSAWRPARPVPVQQTGEQFPPLRVHRHFLFPRTPECPGTQNSLTDCRVEMSFNAIWQCCTNWDVILAALRAFKTT
jgi:hypothetical protein